MAALLARGSEALALLVSGARPSAEMTLSRLSLSLPGAAPPAAASLISHTP